ncbi:allantoicase [Tistlia consotensis]|uniref:Probable allantoicase n=1 Tax=Tistlia consotensis USBA 355 TaxID=560819 RepID=A0A1Y6CQ61_9PROT|nr:allantoicase [Tistlia consotensis]SMF81166.1 allantoicase [Tistlia consotensis USBA 355]SNS23448.1 allantoicase [Tistlia consotensis]
MTDIIAPAPAALPDFTRGAVNLASPRLGTAVVACSDDSFGAAERMLADGPAVFKPGVYDDFGKWMDGWESRRRRDAGHDWAVLRLGVPGTVSGFDLDTSHFTGNYPPAVSIEGADCSGEPGEADWRPVLAPFRLGPSAHHFAEAAASGPWLWLRVHQHPDGGLARLRVYGRVVPDLSGEGAIELSALKRGGRPIAWNDAHYGDLWAVLSEGRGRDMGDGWETRRRREPGHDWLILALAAPGTVERIELDTAHYKGNFPHEVSLQAALVGAELPAEVLVTQAQFWPQLLAPQRMAADSLHGFDAGRLAALGPVDQVKVNLHPDGGLSRIRIFGRPDAAI